MNQFSVLPLAAPTLGFSQQKTKQNKKQQLLVAARGVEENERGVWTAFRRVRNKMRLQPALVSFIAAQFTA